MGMYGERLGRGVTREAARKHETSVTERARRERWQASGCARVVSRKYGTVVVPHGSNFAALLNAAEVWGCDWTENGTQRCGGPTRRKGRCLCRTLYKRRVSNAD